jgi:hypothetical protein
MKFKVQIFRLKTKYKTYLIKLSNCDYEGRSENGEFLLKTLLIKVMRDYSTECVKSDCVTYELVASLVQDGKSVTMDIVIYAGHIGSTAQTHGMSASLCASVNIGTEL